MELYEWSKGEESYEGCDKEFDNECHNKCTVDAECLARDFCLRLNCAVLLPYVIAK